MIEQNTVIFQIFKLPPKKYCEKETKEYAESERTPTEEKRNKTQYKMAAFGCCGC